MPSKTEFYRQMAEQVSTQLVGSWKEWTAFLSTAARLYKYPFHEQMMIYARRERQEEGCRALRYRAHRQGGPSQGRFLHPLR